MLHCEDLHLLIKSNRVNSCDSDTLLIVELILPVLDVEVLQLGRHSLYLVKQHVIFFVHHNLLLLNHVM